jgi:hypothetical protein
MGLVSPKVHVGVSCHSAIYSVSLELRMCSAEIESAALLSGRIFLPQHHLPDFR